MTAPPRLIRLCSHARTTMFNCGDSVLDRQLTLYKERLDDVDRDKADVFAFVVYQEEVVAFISIYDFILHPKSGAVKTRILLMPAIAVSEDFRDSGCALDLIEHAIDIAEKRQEIHYRRKKKPLYDAIAHFPRKDQKIKEILDGLGFRPAHIDRRECWVRHLGV